MSDFEALFEEAPSGYLVTTVDGLIIRVNGTFLKWTGFAAHELVAMRRFQDLLVPGARIYYETHIAPMLQMQGFVREIAVELRAIDGHPIFAILNAETHPSAIGAASEVWMVVIDATERRLFERELQRTQRRLERLQRVTGAFAAAATVEDVAAAGLAEILDGVKGDHGVLAIGETGRLRVVASRGLDESVVNAWESVDVLEEGPVAMVIRTSDPVFLEHDDDQVARPLFCDETGCNLRVALLPLVVDGRSIGILCIASTIHNSFQHDEKDFLRLFADLNAQALDRARLHDAAAVAARRMSLLADLTRALDESTSFDERAQRLVDIVVPAIADYATVEASTRGERRVVAVAHRDPALVEPLHRLRTAAAVSAEQPYSLAAARSTRRPQLITEIGDDLYEQYGLPPDQLELLRLLSPRSYVGLPLQARDTLVGTLMLVASTSSRRFEETDVPFLTEIADRAALALENARLYEHERWVAHSLQRRLFSRVLPNDPRVEMDATYRAGAELVEVGGDWYDAFLVTPDRVGFAVGDVVGRGVLAATVMGQLRTALRAYAVQGGGPAAALGHLDAFAATIDGAPYSSLVYGELDLETGELRYSCAGHPPPVLVDPGGRVDVLWDGRSPLLGLDPDEPKAEAVVLVPAGARLVLYTDGLVETRRRSIAHGIEALVDCLRGHAAIGVDPLVELMAQGGEERDDVCVLAVTRARVTATLAAAARA